MSDQNTSWTEHPSLQNIDAAKLQMLISLAEQGKGKKQNELLPFLMAAAAQSKEHGMSFSQEETNIILGVLKQGKSPAEIQRIEQMAELIRRLSPNARRPSCTPAAGSALLQPRFRVFLRVLLLNGTPVPLLSRCKSRRCKPGRPAYLPPRPARQCR